MSRLWSPGQVCGVSSSQWRGRWGWPGLQGQLGWGALPREERCGLLCFSTADRRDSAKTSLSDLQVRLRAGIRGPAPRRIRPGGRGCTRAPAKSARRGAQKEQIPSAGLSSWRSRRGRCSPVPSPRATANWGGVGGGVSVRVATERSRPQRLPGVGCGVTD